LIGAIAAGATAGGFLGPVRGYLEGFAPLSGGVWRASRDDPPETVETEYGTATLRYDDYGVARVSGDSEAAVYFAIGYAHGADRLFQMDLQRRQMRGELSAIVGEATLDSDHFHTQMDFAAAADVTWDRISQTEAAPLVEAYCDGVNRARADLPLPVEFQLLGAEPDPWQPTDVILAEKQISWGLTGSFRTLRRETLAAEIDREAAEQLHPNRLDHDAAILGHENATDGFSPQGRVAAREAIENPRQEIENPRPLDPELESIFAGVEPPPWVGSNSWAVAGQHTESGEPIMANDPHLTLMAPPVWYEQVLSPPEYRVRGVSFPGVPPVVIGENDHGAWGFTNAGADVIDFYEYETRNDGAEYRHGAQWREFDATERTIEVSGGEDRTLTVKKSVHGAVITRESDGDELHTAGDTRSEIAVAWTGFTATDTTLAVRDLNRSTGIDDVNAALREFDEPTQNCVYADRDGNVLYRVTGKVPIRRTDGEPVAATRVFDGSAREGEWEGYTAFGESSWEGFIPYEEMPHVENPAYVGTANQRVVDDAAYPHYFAEAYSEPYRGIRLWERLDELVDRGNVTPEDMRNLQRDVRSIRAEQFLAVLEAERENLGEERLREAVDTLSAWNNEMHRDSSPALLFVQFLQHYREVTAERVLASELGDRRDPGEYAPNDWVLASLPPDSRWFPEGRTAAVEEALSNALAEIDEQGWETYGDVQRTTITHPFDRGGLNYPVSATDGSASTLFNVHENANAGSSWRQVCPMSDGESECILPGGNDGSPFSEHYADQLRMWADGEFKRMDREMRGEEAVRFDHTPVDSQRGDS
jgi:penicillin amidase